MECMVDTLLCIAPGNKLHGPTYEFLPLVYFIKQKVKDLHLVQLELYRWQVANSAITTFE